MRFREQYAAHREGHTPPDLYTAEENWESRLCAVLELSSPGEITSEFWDLWPKVIKELDAKGVHVGPESFKGWNDGDAGFVRAIWCLVRCLRPKHVVETGVAHGLSSRFILEALERNGDGHLWSIDRPPMEPEWAAQIGIAVDGRFQHRWSYILGSSRRRLPSLLRQLGEIDLFVHDSLHSERNVRFEMDRAWAALRPGGAIVVDDIDVNRGFYTFTQSFSGCDSIACEAEPLRPDLRRFNKKGMFGIVLKENTRTD
jgi:Methyltransferase domain